MGELFKSKVLLLGIFIIVLSVFASAEQKEIHNAWHEYRDTFKLENRVFSLELNGGGSDDSLLRVRIDNDTLFVKLGKCVDYDIYEICYIDKNYEDPNTVVFVNGQTMPGIKILINKELGPNVQITHSIPKFKVSENGKLNITLKSETEVEVDSFRYELIIPPEYTIVNSGQFQQIGNKLILTGLLDKGEEVKYGFTLSSIRPGIKKANYTMSMNGNGVTRYKNGTISLEVVAPYKITISVNPSKPDIVEDSKLSILVENIGDRDLKVNDVTISGSSSLTYFNGKEVSLYAIGKYAANKESIILPDESKEYYIEFTSATTGSYNFTGSVNMNYNGEYLQYLYNKSIVYSVNGLSFNVIPNKVDVLSGEEIDVAYYVVNTADDMTFKNMKLVVNGGFFSESLTLDSLGTNTQRELLRKKYVAPFTEKDLTYKINATLYYYTITNELRQINLTKNLKITSNGTIITIDQITNAKELYAGQELIVEVNVKNMKEEVFNTYIGDIIPEGVVLVGGTTWRNMTLRGKVSDQAYTYKLFIPEDFSGTGLNISSTVKIPDYYYEKSDSTFIKVKFNGTNTTKIKTNTTTSNYSSNKSNVTINKNNTVTKGNGSSINKSETQIQEKPKGIKGFLLKIEAFFNKIFNKG